MIATTPQPPYYAVIFSSLRNEGDFDYAQTAEKMVQLAREQPGFLGIESVRDGLGITVSYWQSPEHIKEWKQQAEHLLAQQKGREAWYSHYKVRICKVERDYGMNI